MDPAKWTSWKQSDSEEGRIDDHIEERSLTICH